MPSPTGLDSPASWRRLAALVALSAFGGVGMWSIVVTLPSVQAEFGAGRGGASFPYMLTMLGVAAGGVIMGRIADKFGIVRAVSMAAIMLGIGYAAASQSGSLWQYTLAHGLLIGMLGTAATFGPLMADVSFWFTRRRALAVSICASGNYIAGAFWPPVVEYASRTVGWRATELGVGLVCVLTMLPLAQLLRPKAPIAETANARGGRDVVEQRLGMSPGLLQTLLVVAGLACCMAMAMPQVHIVAYCGDLGYGPAHGAKMLSIMLGLGIISRIGSGWIADRIGGLATVMAGSALQGLSLLLYLGFDSLTSLYLISALFGLVQGGIVPSYAVIVREYFPPNAAATRIGLVLMSSVAGMGFGGLASGLVYDLTGTYRAAFANGVAWNLLNGAIILTLIIRAQGRGRGPAYA